MNKKSNKRIVAVLSALTFLSACGNGIRDPSATDPEFAGLDQAVVEELLGLPYFEEGESPQSYESQEEYNRQAASYVYIMQVCRDYRDAYLDWMETGQQPDTPQPPAVALTGIDFSLADHGQAALTSGDSDELFEFLADSESCGAWVPARPGWPATIGQELVSQQDG